MLFQYFWPLCPTFQRRMEMLDAVQLNFQHCCVRQTCLEKSGGIENKTFKVTPYSFQV